MEKTSLIYNEAPYSDDEIASFTEEFRNKGYVVLPKVFDRESVKQFKEELEKIMFYDGTAYTIPDDKPHYIVSVLAPRGRQVLPYALSHSIAKAMPALHTSIFVIETDEMRGQYAPEWHKDREPDGMPGNEYHYPKDVFLAFYLNV